MGHNYSARKRSAAVLAMPLAQLHGWRLAVECHGEQCASGRAYDVKQLATMYRGLTVGEAVRRMRCDRCRKPPVDVVLRPGPEMRGVRAEAVAIVGAGSV